MYNARNMPLSTEMMEIQIFDEDGIVAEFQPCWESNFRGLIWVQTRGFGYICYSLKGTEWVENKDAVKPDYIIGRYG